MDASPSTPAKVIATAGLILATLMHSLDNTIANVALPHLQGSLSASQDQIVWVLTSYIVGTAIMTPLSGWLSLKIGRKPLLLISIVCFIAVSILCGTATSLPEIVLFRFLQGASGAALLPLSQATLLDMWPLPVIPQVIAIWSCAVMVAPIFGPTLGGFLTEHFSWRWVFYINLPIGAVAFSAIFLAMPRDKGGKQRPFDLLGFAAIVIGSVAVQLMVDRGPGEDWFDSREILLYAILAGCALYVFVVHMATARNPFFRADLFRDRNYISCIFFTLVVQAVLFSTIALLPTFLQTLLGYSAIQSGMAVTPRGVGSLLAFAAAPWMAAHFGPRRTVALGIAFAAYSLWQMAQFDTSMPVGPIHFTGFLQGVSQGLMFNPVAVMGFATLKPEIRTEASVFSNTVRTLGSSIGVAVVQAHLLRYSAVAHEQLAAGVVPSDPVVRSAMPPGFGEDPGALLTLNAELTRQASMMSYDTIFAWMGVATLMMFPLLFLMRPAKIKGETLQEVRVE